MMNPITTIILTFLVGVVIAGVLLLAFLIFDYLCWKILLIPPTRLTNMLFNLGLDDGTD